MARLSHASTRPRQRGFTLIEVLVAVLVFSLGVLGLVGLQATAIRFSTDSQQRADATFLADQLLGRMLISDPGVAADFAHNPGGNVACAPTGGASTHPMVTEWLREVQETLPNAAAAQQQIVVDAATRQVTVKLCWRSGGRTTDTPHQLVVSNQVQWQ